MDNRYDLVSSLYGPGPTACWYLTVAACLVPWTLRPKKRHSGSIDADLVAVLTFPTVAAAHLISQVHMYPSHHATSTAADEVRLLQLNAAIEASLNITETSMEMLQLLFIVAVVFRCVKRGLLIGFIGVFCFAAEGYLYLSNPSIRRAQGSLSRSFLVDRTKVLIFVFVLLMVLIATAFILIVMYYATRRHPNPSASRAVPESIRENVINDTYLEDSRIMGLFAEMSFFLLPLTFIASLTSLFPMYADILSLASSDVKWLEATRRRVLEEFFPHTSLSIADLDQAVAVLAGATVLVLSLHSAALAHYKQWSDDTRLRREQHTNEMLSLQQLRLQPIQTTQNQLARPPTAVMRK